MNGFKKILVPIDLSDRSQGLIDLATGLAKSNNAKLAFVYVALPPLPTQAAYGKSEMDALILQEKAEFNKIKPSDQSVDFERHFLQGNPGPDLVNFAQENKVDLIVLGTHGRSGILRLLMGSVAEYVVRHAHCPVVTFKHRDGEFTTKNRETDSDQDSQIPKSPYVTNVMSHATSVQKHVPMADVVKELEAAKATAAPVVDETGKCIGILTKTDIHHYHELQRRYYERDPSVIPEIFEKDEFGLCRTNNESFNRVERHMTHPVITVTANETCEDAKVKFAENPKIHHLIIVDQDDSPIGIVEPHQLDALCPNNAKSTAPSNA